MPYAVSGDNIWGYFHKHKFFIIACSKCTVFFLMVCIYMYLVYEIFSNKVLVIVSNSAELGHCNNLFVNIAVA